MKGYVLGDEVLLDSGEVYTLGCACTSPRRCLKKINKTKDEKLIMIQKGTYKEVKGRIR